MNEKILTSTHEKIPPGRHLHFVYRGHGEEIPLRVAVIGKKNLSAEACLDGEGWVVIILTNTGEKPVVITPETPLKILIFPRKRFWPGYRCFPCASWRA